MRSILSVLFSAVRARIMPLWIKLRLWLSPSYLRSKGFVKIREFFVRLLDVRPRHQQDYYSIFRWLVSKRLAFAVVVAMGLISAIYIAAMLPRNVLRSDGDSVQTYKYRSIPLKFHSGNVKILARDGYVAYSGYVDKGAASGQGTLYSADGSAVYEGQFENNRYNGAGTLYYPDGTPHYTGLFTDNVFNGTGKLYRAGGVMEYEGEFLLGVRNGQGTLYNSVGDRIFSGNFLNDRIVYHDFLARATSEVAGLYSGDTIVYQSESEYCVAMPEIRAVYAVKDGSNTLENEWTVDRIYVLENSICLNGTNCSTIRQLQMVFGDPLYFGTSWVTLPETVAWNELASDRDFGAPPITITTQATLENVLTVSGYDRDRELYLYTFEKSGILHSFYFTGAGESEFVMYAIEKA